MSGDGFMRRGKLKGSTIALTAARHNLREIQAERGLDSHIDGTRAHLNEVLAGPSTAKEVSTLADQRMREAGIDPKRFRKDGVRAVEVVCSLPADFHGDDREYFVDCLKWAASRYGGAENVVSAVVHRDEARPHCHIIIVPVLKGRMAGSDMASYHKAVLAADQNDFYQQVAFRHGLKRAPPRLSSGGRTALATAVLRRLRATNDAALRSALWPSLRMAIEADPRPHAEALGVVAEPSSKAMKTMAQIFTSPGKGPRKEPNPMRFDGSTIARTLSCVGFAPETLLLPSTPAARSLQEARAEPVPDQSQSDDEQVACEELREAVTADIESAAGHPGSSVASTRPATGPGPHLGIQEGYPWNQAQGALPTNWRGAAATMM